MSEKKYERLSDAVLAALRLAVEQKDLAISDLLSLALDRAMTRGAGGKDFVERREFTDELDVVLQKLGELRKSKK